MSTNMINEFNARYAFLVTYLAITFGIMAHIDYQWSMLVTVATSFVDWIVAMVLRHKIAVLFLKDW